MPVTAIGAPLLVMLPVIMVGQNVLGRKQELQADESFETTKKTYADSEEMLRKLERLETGVIAILKRLEGK